MQIEKINGNRNYLNNPEFRTEEGYLDLDKIPYTKLKKYYWEGHYSLGYVMFPDESIFFMKNTEKNDKIHLFNNIIIPEIAKQAGIETAFYLIAYSANNDKLYLLSPNFLNKNEELIYDFEMVNKSLYTNNDEIYKNLDIDFLLNNRYNYLSSRGVPAKHIEKMQNEFLIQSFFSKFIDQTDEKMENTALIVDGNDYRLAPLFDTDYSTLSANYGVRRYVDNDKRKNDLTSFLKHFSNNQNLMQFISHFINIFDIDTAIKNAEIETGVAIPDEIKIKYIDFFNGRLDLLKEFMISKNLLPNINHENNLENDFQKHSNITPPEDLDR